MNRKTTLALTAGSALAALLAATSSEAGVIANRQARQQTRIAQGVASGQLTPRETARLEGREAALNRSIARMGSDGSLSAGERLRIQSRENRISRGIYRQKHDAQHR
jgi:hypothetical protein